MTFEQFLATREWSDDLGPIYDGAHTEAGTPPPRGWVYATHYCIEVVQPHWPEQARAAGAFYLMLGNLEWLTDDLRSLEQRLYDYARIETDVTPSISAAQMAEFERLAQIARPIDEADYGSVRHADADTTFWYAIGFYEDDDALGSEFSRFSRKATSDEAIDEALRILRGRVA